MNAVITIVWGDAFWKVFNQVCLPSFYGSYQPVDVTTNNTIQHFIITFRDEMTKLKFPINAKFVFIEDLIELKEVTTSTPIMLQSKLVSLITEKFEPHDTIAILPPDVIWPKGFLPQLNDVIENYEVGYLHYIRIDEDVLNSTQNLVGNGSDELLKLIFEYWLELEEIHKLNGKLSTIWPEYTTMYSAQTGWYATTITDKEPFFWRNKHRLNKFNQLTTAPPGKIFIFGTDDLGNFGASLAPKNKDSTFPLEQDKGRFPLQERALITAKWKTNFGSTPSYYFQCNIIKIGKNVPQHAIDALKCFSQLSTTIAITLEIDKCSNNNITDNLLNRRKELFVGSFASETLISPGNCWVVVQFQDTILDKHEFLSATTNAIVIGNAFAIPISARDFYQNYASKPSTTTAWLPNQMAMIDQSLFEVVKITFNAAILKPSQSLVAHTKHRLVNLPEYRNGILWRFRPVVIKTESKTQFLRLGNKNLELQSPNSKSMFISDGYLYVLPKSKYRYQKLVLLKRKLLGDFASIMRSFSEKLSRNLHFGAPLVRWLEFRLKTLMFLRMINRSKKISPRD